MDGLTRSLPLIRPRDSAMYVARIPAAPFAVANSHEPLARANVKKYRHDAISLFGIPAWLLNPAKI
jgi:hypothetical protein